MHQKLYNDVYLKKVQKIFNKTTLRSFDLLNFKNSDCIADICCGSGEILKEIAKDAKFVYGIDNDAFFLEIAHEKCREFTSIKLINCDANKIPLPDNSLDKILIHRGFQHIKNHEQVIKECYRLLKPSGILQIVEPDYLSYTLFIEDIIFERKLIDFIAYERIPNSYKIRQIPNLLIENGFSIQLREVHNYNIDSYELANYLINFNNAVELGYSKNEFTDEEYNKWQKVKNLPGGQFNLSINLLLFNSSKITNEIN